MAKQKVNEKRSQNTLLDFIYLFGISSFEEVPFLDPDSGIFSWISYFPFEEFELLNDKYKPMTIGELCRDYIGAQKLLNEELLVDPMVAASMALLTSTRYASLVVSRIEHYFSKEETTQYFAMEILLPDNTFVVAYRGTDVSLTGWKEDFNMACYKSVASQDMAKDFLLKAIENNPGKRFRAMGHSKGGNLANYACSFLEEKEKELINVYSLDGPGLLPEIFDSPGHKRIQKRIVHVVPQDDVVGVLLNHDPIRYIIKTNKPGDFIESHYLQNWLIDDSDFMTVEERSPMSLFMEVSLDDLLNTKLTNKEKRRDLVHVLFETIEKSGVHDANVIFKDPIAFLRKFIETARKSKYDRKVLTSALGDLIASFRNNYSTFQANNKMWKKKQKKLGNEKK